jgi:hypothetical protein
VLDLDGFFVVHYSFDDYGALLESGNPRLTLTLVQPLPGAPRRDSGRVEVLVLDGGGQPIGRYSLGDAMPSAGGALEVTA